MIFNDHSKLEGRHAFLGASNFRWINYNDEILEKRFYSQYATSIGTIIHELAADLIKSRIKLTKSDRRMIELILYKQGIPKGAYDSRSILLNLLPFVNDAIGFHMESEIILYYSINAFGTTDAISYNQREKKLRIHDLKNGVTKTHIEQLIVYAALFCLEYKMNPKLFETELRIYQNMETLIYIPECKEIEKFMELIKSRNKFVSNLLEGNFRI